MADPAPPHWRAARDVVADAIATWRRNLGYAHDSDSAATARLRRIGPRDNASGLAELDVGAAIAVDAYRTLFNRITAVINKLEKPRGLPYSWTAKSRRDHPDSSFDERLALVASVLAHVKSDTGGQLGKMLHAKRYSELRFQRFLQLETQVELQREGRRLVRMLGGDVPVASLARALLFWDAQEARALARSYYDSELFGTSDATQNQAENTIEDSAQ
jgi:hypothetical protein